MYTAKVISIGLLCVLILGCDEAAPPAPPPLEIPVANVKQQDVPIVLEMVGQTRGSRDIPIRTRVDGTLESMHFLEGRKVDEGQLLYTIETRPFDSKVIEANGYLREAQTALIKAKSDLDRIRPLAEINAVSKQDLDSSIAQYDAANAAVQTAEAKVEQAEIELGYTSIHSPIAGRIGLSHAKVGEYVGKDPNPIVLNYVSQIDPITVKFSINEREYLRIAREFIQHVKKQDALYEANASELEDSETPNNMELILADGKIHEHKGRITTYEASIDPTTGSLSLEADFPNPDGLVLAGQFARVRAVIETKKNATVIPQRAVAELQGVFQVFVVDKNNVIEIREVETGAKYENNIIIEKGLSKDERVATEGLLRLRNGMSIVVKNKTPMQDNKSNPAGGA